MNKVAQTILREGQQKEIRDQYLVFWFLSGVFFLGFIFLLLSSESPIQPAFYLGLSISYLLFANFYHKYPTKQQATMLRAFQFYCVHTSAEFFYEFYPDLVSGDDARESVRRMDKGLILLIILFVVKYGYLAFRIGMAIHFYRVLTLFRKVAAASEEKPE